MVYTLDGQSVYLTDNPTDIKSGQRALPLYTAETLEAVAAERERCALICEKKIVEPTGTYQIVRYQILMAAAKEIRKGE